MRTVEWKLSLQSSPQKTYNFLNSSEGREQFWAKAAPEHEGVIHFEFVNGWTYQSKIYDRIPGRLFKLDYFNSEVTFNLTSNEYGGTDVQLINTKVPEDDFLEVLPGWVSVLLSLKAALEFRVDLRSHDTSRTWDQRYVDV